MLVKTCENCHHNWRTDPDDRCETCRQYIDSPEWELMTNADMVRSMNDGDMARFLCKLNPEITLVGAWEWVKKTVETNGEQINS